MPNHLLIDELILTDVKKVEKIKNSEYDEVRGLWLWGDEKEVLVKSKNADCPIRGTKKMEQETGEDLKGE